MALRLRGNLTNATNSLASVTGFDLVFTNGMVYDLDDIVTKRSRNTHDAALVLQVKKNAEITKKLVEKFRADIATNLENVLKREEVKAKLFEIIDSAMREYEVKSLTSEFFETIVLKYIRSKADAYLKQVCADNALEFELSVITNTVNVTYQFRSPDILGDRFLEVYDEYLQAYEDELAETSVGGMAISDKEIRLNIKTEDYQKYLLDEEESTDHYSTPGTRKPLVIWTEATEDINTGEEVQTVFDIIEDLRDEHTDMYHRIQILEELLRKYREEKIDDQVGVHEYSDIVVNGSDLEISSGLELELTRIGAMIRDGALDLPLEYAEIIEDTLLVKKW